MYKEVCSSAQQRYLSDGGEKSIADVTGPAAKSLGTIQQEKASKLSFYRGLRYAGFSSRAQVPFFINIFTKENLFSQ